MEEKYELLSAVLKELQEKDLMAAISIGELCLDYENRKERLKTIFNFGPF